MSKSEALDVVEMQKNTLKEKLLEEITCYKVTKYVPRESANGIPT